MDSFDGFVFEQRFANKLELVLALGNDLPGALVLLVDNLFDLGINRLRVVSE
jgi:hypothetical protein